MTTDPTFTRVEGAVYCDTGGFLAVAPQYRPWAVRASGLRTEHGYPLDATLAALATAEPPILVTAAQAETLWGAWGLRAGTVRNWAYLGKIQSFEDDTNGHPLYSAWDILRRAGLAPFATGEDHV